MSARSKVWGACRSLAVRSRAPAPKSQPFLHPITTRSRWYSDESNNSNKPSSRAPPETNAADYLKPEQSNVLPSTPGSANAHAAAREAESQQLGGLGDAELEQLFYSGRVTPKEGDPGLTEAQQEKLFAEGTILPAEEAEALVKATRKQELQAVDEDALAESRGFKFPLPMKPYPSDINHKKRYHPVLEQLTRLMMRDGKLSVAQRNMSIILNYLRTSPAPIYSPKFPLLPGTPPASHLPLNPILYMTIAIDSVAPLLKIKMIPGAAGGGRSLEVPTPLAVRQRRRFAFKWILDVVEKKPSKGSGRKQFPYRIAEEIVAVVEGRSSVWDKRKTIHKQGTGARANVGNETKHKKVGRRIM